MKTTAEIRAKIDHYLQRLEAAKTPEAEERCCLILDALLWVIEDNSGCPI